MKAQETARDKREKALLLAVKRAKLDRHYEYDYEMADFLGLCSQSYSQYKKRAFQNMNFDLFCEMARKLKLTGREVCEAVGVPYE